MKLPKTGKQPTEQRGNETSHHPSSKVSQYRPSPISRPPEPVPVERPSRLPLNKLLYGSPTKDQEQATPTTTQRRSRLSSWLRLQLNELRQTAESAFAGKDERSFEQKTDTIEQVKWQKQSQFTSNVESATQDRWDESVGPLFPKEGSQEIPERNLSTEQENS